MGDKAAAAAAPEVVVKPLAFQLAKGWLQKMTGGEDFDGEKDEDEGEPEARPLRLGLGAKYVPHSQAAVLSPVSKQIRRQIDNARKGEEDKAEGGADEEEEEESRTRAFGKNKMLEKQAIAVKEMHAVKKKKKKNQNKKQKLQST